MIRCLHDLTLALQGKSAGAATCDQMVKKFLKLLENYFFLVFSDSLFLAINKGVLGFSVSGSPVIAILIGRRWLENLNKG